MPRRRASQKRRRRATYARAGAAIIGFVALSIAVIGVTAANSVAPSNVDDTASAQNAQDIAPTGCDDLGLTAVVNGATGTAANELVLGTSGTDLMNGGDGSDCVLGGGTADELEGGAGYDVCIGGGGTDVLGPSCEVKIQ